MKVYRIPHWARLWRFIDTDRRGSLDLVTLQNPKGSYGIIENVFVKEEFRNQGIASSLIKEAIQTAKEKNLYKITLTCTDEMISFYSKFGFEWKNSGQGYCMRIDLK
tara:strand:- start:394 stop:714 length:321 start_codon:yes stop_codon:yes gene_type:complete